MSFLSAPWCVTECVCVCDPGPARCWCSPLISVTPSACVTLLSCSSSVGSPTSLWQTLQLLHMYGGKRQTLFYIVYFISNSGLNCLFCSVAEYWFPHFQHFSDCIGRFIESHSLHAPFLYLSIYLSIYLSTHTYICSFYLRTEFIHENHSEISTDYRLFFYRGLTDRQQLLPAAPRLIPLSSSALASKTHQDWQSFQIIVAVSRSFLPKYCYFVDFFNLLT